MMNKYTLIFELCNCKGHDLYDNEKISSVFNSLLKRSGFSIVSSMKHEFTPQGLTFVSILSESHALVHTFPEESRLSIDLYTCSEPDKLEIFIEEALQEFEPGKYFFKVVNRNKIVEV